jgi:hypothetical protein
MIPGIPWFLVDIFPFLLPHIPTTASVSTEASYIRRVINGWEGVVTMHGPERLGFFYSTEVAQV